MSLIDLKVFECYNCENEITNINTSVEHIIPNAIGGKLKSRHLLCSTCNALYGNTIDKELAKSVKELCNFLMIDRRFNQTELEFITKLDKRLERVTGY